MLRALAAASSKWKVRWRIPHCTTFIWLVHYAKFELLNDRGEPARRAALATFHREIRTHLLPTDALLKLTKPADGNAYRWRDEMLWEGTFPDEAHALAVSKEQNGRRWAAFRCHYLGPQEHIWFVQSGEEKWPKHWRQPAFGFNLTARCTQGGLPTGEDFKLAYAQGILRLKWREIMPPDRQGKTREIRHTEQIAIDDLYRDSDGDGIPDLVEHEMGLDPHRADTNHNGLPDGRDKNPLYKSHPLTEQEAIYQAVVEALCQLGRSMLVSNGKTIIDDGGTPAPFGRGTAPLLLPAPPGSEGVEVRGHSGMVFCRPDITRKWASTSTEGAAMDNADFHFTAPCIGLDGFWYGLQQRLEKKTRPADPFIPMPSVSPLQKPLSFKDYFPVVLSSDGRRARIGFQSDLAGRWGGQIRFDVEVRKLGGQWLPVECRRVYWSGRHFSDVTVVPIHDRANTREIRSRWRYNSF